MFHAYVPAQLMTVVDELPDENPEMLAGNTWNAAVIGAVARRAMAHSTLLEQLCPVREIGLRTQGAFELGSRS
jgi:hypothetical protein